MASPCGKPLPVYVSGSLPESIQEALQRSTDLQVEEFFRVWLCSPAGQAAVKDSIAAAKDGFSVETSPGRAMLMSPPRSSPLSPGGFSRQMFSSPPLSPSARSASFGAGFSTGPLSPSRAGHKTSPLSPMGNPSQSVKVDDVYPSADVISAASANSPTFVASMVASGSLIGGNGGPTSPHPSRSPLSPSHGSGAAAGSLPFSPTNRSPSTLSGGVRVDGSPPVAGAGATGALSPSNGGQGALSPGIAATSPGIAARGRSPSGISAFLHRCVSVGSNGTEVAGFAVSPATAVAQAQREVLRQAHAVGAGSAAGLHIEVSHGASGGVAPSREARSSPDGHTSPPPMVMSPRLLRNISAPAAIEGLGTALGFPGYASSAGPASAVSSPASSPSMSPAPTSPLLQPDTGGREVDGPGRPEWEMVLPGSIPSPVRQAGAGVVEGFTSSPPNAGQLGVVSPGGKEAETPEPRPTQGRKTSPARLAASEGKEADPVPMFGPPAPAVVPVSNAPQGRASEGKDEKAEKSREVRSDTAAGPPVGHGSKGIPTFFRRGVGPIGTGVALQRAHASRKARSLSLASSASLAMGPPSLSMADETSLDGLLPGFGRLAIVHAKLRPASAGAAPSSYGGSLAAASGTVSSSTSVTASGSSGMSVSSTDPLFSARPVLPGDSLEARLGPILEAFRKHSATGAVPAHPYSRFNERARKKRAERAGAGLSTGKGAGGAGSRPGSGATSRPSLSGVGLGGTLGGRRSSGVGAAGKGPNGRRLSGASVGTVSGEEEEGGEGEGVEEGTGPKPITVSVTCCGVRLTWEDAHAAVSVDHFATLTKPLVGFPSFFAAPLFRRIRQMYGGPKAVEAKPVAPTEWVSDAAALESALDKADKASTSTGKAAVATGRASLGGGRSRSGSDGKGEGASAIASIGGGERVLVCSPQANPLPGTQAERDKESSDRDNTGLVTLPQFLAFWRAEVERYDPTERFVRVLAARYRPSALHPSDFQPVLEELLAYHPGLAFLENTPEFQDKYARTVIARIVYCADAGGRNVLDVRAVRACEPPLLAAFATVDVEEDINAVNAFFSYEHFYVLYCKFWELDSDHDFLLSRSDLARMTHLTPTALDRVFAQTGRRFVAGTKAAGMALTTHTPAKMGYEDFCAFFLACEDKTHPSSLRFWFNVADMDGDGVLSASDMRAFWPDQTKRMREHGLEVVKFEDMLCQFHDLLQPAVEGRIYFGDFVHHARVKLTGTLFNALFDLDKFQRFEAREAPLVKQGENYTSNQWDRYAAAEYQRLAAEEEDGGSGGGGGASGQLAWG